MAVVTAPAAPLDLPTIQTWIKQAEAMSPHGWFVPNTYARIEIGGLLGLPLTDRHYAPGAWLAYMRRARRVLATRV